MAMSGSRRQAREVAFLHQLSQAEISAKALILPKPPVSSVYLCPSDGPPQDQDENFSVNGTTLSWTALGLGQTLSNGDEIYIRYMAY